MGAEREEPFYISRPEQVRAVASPARQEIIDAVGVIGPCTAAELAAFVGRRPDSLYYHLRQLRDVGLLAETASRSAQGRAVAVYDVPGRPMFLRYDLSTRASTADITRFAASMLRSASRGFARAAHSGSAVASGPARDLWAARWKGWLTADELGDVNQLFSRLIALLRRGTPGAADNARLCELTLVLAPVAPRRPAKQRKTRGGDATAPGARRR